MRSYRTDGSVRGVPGDRHPYRDSIEEYVCTCLRSRSYCGTETLDNALRIMTGFALAWYWSGLPSEVYPVAWAFRKPPHGIAQMGSSSKRLDVGMDTAGIAVAVVDPSRDKLSDFTFKLLRSGFQKL